MLTTPHRHFALLWSRRFAPNIFLYVIMPICGIFWKVEGAENRNAIHVDKCLFVSNHISNFDPIWFNCVFRVRAIVILFTFGIFFFFFFFLFEQFQYCNAPLAWFATPSLASLCFALLCFIFSRRHHRHLILYSPRRSPILGVHVALLRQLRLVLGSDETRRLAEPRR